MTREKSLTGSEFNSVIQLRLEVACIVVLAYQFFLHKAIKKCLDDWIFIMITRRDTGEFASLLAYIEFRIRMSAARNTIEANEVLHVTYERALKKLQRGEWIENLPGWFRKTSMNIIFEISRDRQRQDNIHAKIVHEIQCVSRDDSLSVIAMIEAIESLDSTAKNILILRAEGRSWNEVASILVDMGLFTNSKSLVNTITKIATRARERLRQYYGDD